MKIMLRYIYIFIIMTLFIVGCAGNKPQPDQESSSEATGEDIDSLFGTGTEEAASQQNDEAEVLKLLGITKEESAGAQEEEAQPEVNEEKESQLRDEISQLEQQLSEKESEIANLKSEIAVKDQKIEELETTNTTTRTRATSYSGGGDFRQEYDYALSEYYNRNYKSAISKFEALLARNSNHPLSDNCQYWIGECYYGMGNYNQAIVEFTKVFSFNKSNKLDDAQLKLGLCYLKMGDKDKARQEFERLLSDYPKSEYVEKAEYYLSRL